MSTRSSLTVLLALSLLACGDDGGSDDDQGSTSDIGGSSTEGGSDGSDDDTTTGTPTDMGTGTETDTGQAMPTCNGHAELCDRPFDQVVFAGTHNAHSATDEGFSVAAANQTHAVAQQLEDGVRVLLMDAYPDPDDPETILLCHGSCNFGSSVHAEVLGDIVAFLQANPGEIVSIIYEEHVEQAPLQAEIEALAGPLLFTHVAGDPWPTLGEMVAADTRLLITSEHGGPPPPWYHYIWDLAWDTPYGPTDAADLSCDLNRGAAGNDLFLVNHWVNNAFGLPSAENAMVVNAYDFLLARTQECWAQWDHPTNFVAVDFYDRGDLIAVVDTLNGF